MQGETYHLARGEPKSLGFPAAGTEFHPARQISLDFPDLVQLFLQGSHAVHYQPSFGYWLDRNRHEDYAQAAADFEKINGF
jgi:hypothetical protein